MNRKLLVLLGISILTLATPATFADDGADTAAPTTQGQGGGRRGEALERFRAALEQLDLSPQQKTQIKSILTEARTKLQALKGQSDARTQARPIIQQALKDIMAALDDTQKAKLKEILEKDRAQAKS